jgi:hypothetical protein
MPSTGGTLRARTLVKSSKAVSRVKPDGFTYFMLKALCLSLTVYATQNAPSQANGPTRLKNKPCSVTYQWSAMPTYPRRARSPKRGGARFYRPRRNTPRSPRIHDGKRFRYGGSHWNRQSNAKPRTGALRDDPIRFQYRRTLQRAIARLPFRPMLAHSC